MTKAEQLAYIAKTLGIAPNEHIWEDGTTI